MCGILVANIRYKLVAMLFNDIYGTAVVRTENVVVRHRYTKYIQQQLQRCVCWVAKGGACTRIVYWLHSKFVFPYGTDDFPCSTRVCVFLSVLRYFFNVTYDTAKLNTVIMVVVFEYLNMAMGMDARAVHNRNQNNQFLYP